MDRKMKLSDKFDKGQKINKKVNVRVTGDIPKAEGVEVYFTVMLDDTKMVDAIDIDYNVRFASTLRNSFNSQKDLKEFANKYATSDNPYKVHVTDLGRKIRTPEQKKAEMKRYISGLSPEERAELLKEVS